jgi:hypothetical protein
VWYQAGSFGGSVQDTTHSALRPPACRIAAVLSQPRAFANNSRAVLSSSAVNGIHCLDRGILLRTGTPERLSRIGCIYD